MNEWMEGSKRANERERVGECVAPLTELISGGGAGERAAA